MQENIMDSNNVKIPDGHNTINTFIIIKGDASKFIEFTKYVFDAQERNDVKTPDKDGKLIHAEVIIGNSTLMIADSKDDWPFTPAFIQIYVSNIDNIINKAKDAGSNIITEKSKFYGGYNLARIQDPFGNIWWIYEPAIEKENNYNQSDTSWHDRKPSYIYLTLLDAMNGLNNPKWNKS
jgi:uncharacterized glyoxalase superfamily protein PhnB